MGSATKTARRRQRSDELAIQMLAALRDKWRGLKTQPIKTRMDWLASNEAIIALGSKTARALLKSLKVECALLKEKCPPGSNFANVVEDGAPYPTGRIICRCKACNGKVEWPKIYVGSGGLSYECELELMPNEISRRLPSSPSGRTMRLIRIMKIRIEMRRTRLGWKKGARKTGDW